MLNYDKIHSVINRERTSKIKLAQFIGISKSTFIDRLNKENLMPNDVYGIARYFNKSIGYFFDEEEQDIGNTSNISNKENESNEPEQPYGNYENLEKRIKQLENYFELIKLSKDINEFLIKLEGEVKQDQEAKK